LLASLTTSPAARRSYGFESLTYRAGRPEDVVRAPGETEIDRDDTVHIAINGPTHVFTTDGRRLGN
jgi:hypothetical protein